MLKGNKENLNSKYCGSKNIITTLEKYFGMSITEIKKSVSSARVNLTDEEIKTFLEQKFIEEKPDLKQWIDEKKNDNKCLNKQFTMDEQFEESCKYFSNMLALKKYEFEPYTLEYFKKYIKIVRKKVLILLDIIEKIGNKEVSAIGNIMEDLDIVLDKKGNILKEDIERLIKPTIANINILNDKLNKANDLSTYLTFKISRQSIYRNDFSENELYPLPSLQDKHYLGFNREEYVPLSKGHQKQLDYLQTKSRRKLAKLLMK